MRTCGPLSDVRLCADRCANAPPAFGVEGPDCLRLRRRHLARIQEGRQCRSPDVVARRRIVSAVLAGRHEGGLQRFVRRKRRRLRRSRAGRRTEAAHVSPDGRSRDRVDAGRQARAVCVGTRERTSALQPVLSPSQSMAACRRNCPSRTASSAPTRRMARQFVYMPMSQDFRNWKRYRGGWAPGSDGSSI